MYNILNTLGVDPYTATMIVIMMMMTIVRPIFLDRSFSCGVERNVSADARGQNAKCRFIRCAKTSCVKWVLLVGQKSTRQPRISRTVGSEQCTAADCYRTFSIAEN